MPIVEIWGFNLKRTTLHRGTGLLAVMRGIKARKIHKPMDSTKGTNGRTCWAPWYRKQPYRRSHDLEFDLKQLVALLPTVTERDLLRSCRKGFVVGKESAGRTDQDD